MKNATVCYNVRCDPFYHHFTDLNTAIDDNSWFVRNMGPSPANARFDFLSSCYVEYSDDNFNLKLIV